MGGIRVAGSSTSGAAVSTLGSGCKWMDRRWGSREEASAARWGSGGSGLRGGEQTTTQCCGARGEGHGKGGWKGTGMVRGGGGGGSGEDAGMKNVGTHQKR